MKGGTFQTQRICEQVEADDNVIASGMIWMNLKREAPLCNAFYAMKLAIGTLIVPLSSLPVVLGVDEATGDEEAEEEEEEEEEEGEEEARLH
jgi:hypothetical protein